jgi:hypothetical protein
MADDVAAYPINDRFAFLHREQLYGEVAADACAGGEGRRNRMQSVDDADALIRNDSRFIDLKVRNSPEHLTDDRLPDGSREVRAEAAMDPQPERGMAVRCAVQMNFAGVVELGRIVIGARP